jgi:hypothetical protein
MNAVVKELLDIQRDYKYARGHWKILLDKLREYKGRRGENFPEYKSNDDYITYEFAGTKLFCCFSFKKDKGVLMYGYVDQDEKHIVTAYQFVDKEGHIKNSPDAATVAGEIAIIEDYERFFFPQILNAQKKAWDKMMPE